MQTIDTNFITRITNQKIYMFFLELRRNKSTIVVSSVFPWFPEHVQPRYVLYKTYSNSGGGVWIAGCHYVKARMLSLLWREIVKHFSLCDYRNGYSTMFHSSPSLSDARAVA